VPQLLAASDRGILKYGKVSGRGTVGTLIDCTTCDPDPNVSVTESPDYDADFGEFSSNPIKHFSV
jgi:hypothetical protein